MNTLVTNYLTKLEEIKTICDNNTTTMAQLDAKVDELALIETDITTEMNNGLMSHFVTILDLDDFMKCRNEMNNRVILQTKIHGLVNIKNVEYKNKMANLATQEELEAFAIEINEIKKYYRDNVMVLLPLGQFKCRMSSCMNI